MDTDKTPVFVWGVRVESLCHALGTKKFPPIQTPTADLENGGSGVGPCCLGSGRNPNKMTIVKIASVSVAQHTQEHHANRFYELRNSQKLECPNPNVIKPICTCNGKDSPKERENQRHKQLSRMPVQTWHECKHEDENLQNCWEKSVSKRKSLPHVPE
jgi:hypothetical protein